MASCDWMKIKGAGEAKAMFRHCDEEKRLECEHSNKDIDKTRTHLNLSFGAFEDGYEAVCKAYDDFIADLDSLPGANKRKDRVTLVGWSIPAPKGMDENTAREWTVELYRLMIDRYDDVLLGGTAHFDEVHEYKNAETGKTEESRIHVHMYAVPAIDGKLNAKQFMSRKNMVQMNNAIEAMTQARFPGYRFMDGTQKKSTKSVEELKNESALREAIEQAQAEAERIIAEAWKRADDMEAEASQKIDEANQYAEDVQESVNSFMDASEKEAERRSEQIIKDAEHTAALRRLEGSQSRREASELLTEARTILEAVKALEEAQRSSEGAKLQRALEFMDSIRYKDGTTVKDRFERRELVFGHKATPKRSRAEIEAEIDNLCDRVNQQKQSDGEGYDF